MNYVKLVNRHKLPSRSGIYIVRIDGVPRYVGQSTNLYHRWNDGGERKHHRLEQALREARAGKVVYLEFVLVPPRHLDFVEAVHINRCKKACEKKGEKFWNVLIPEVPKTPAPRKAKNHP